MVGILLVLIISLLFYIYLKNKRVYEAGDKFPGPKALPILGNSLDFASSSHGIFLKLTEFSRKYERFFRIWNNGKLYVICYRHKDAEVLLSNNKVLKKTNVYRYMKPWIGDGLISTSDIELWRRHRKIITPTFHFKILHDFLDVFNRNAHIFCEKLKPKAGKGTFDVSKLVKLAFLDDICETAMGANVNAQNNSESEYVKAVKECWDATLLNEWESGDRKPSVLFREMRQLPAGLVHEEFLLPTLLKRLPERISLILTAGDCTTPERGQRWQVWECELATPFSAVSNPQDIHLIRIKLSNIVSLRFFKVWLMIDTLFNLTKYSKTQKNCLQILHGMTSQVIRERRQNLNSDEPAEDAYGKRKLAFLDLLLQSKEGFKLSDQELREEVDTFMFAGHDTLSSAVSFALYSLAANPEIQEKAYKEQYELFGESNEQPTYADLQEMKYLERVVKEVLRLYPSAPIIGRELCEDFILPDDCLVPKGAQLIINIFALHRDPEVWPEPEKFNPDNFLPEAVQSRSPYSYIPFSAGPRNCIGQKYALLAMKATISWVLRKYKILPSPYREHKLHLAAEIVLLSTNGYHIQIKIRE